MHRPVAGLENTYDMHSPQGGLVREGPEKERYVLKQNPHSLALLGTRLPGAEILSIFSKVKI